MKRILHRLLVVAGLGFLLAAGSGCATKGYDSVIVTSNYVKSRLLAELIQAETKQPIVLLPTGAERDTLYAMNTSRGREFPKTRFRQIIEFMSPRTIIFLGDERFSPTEYRDKVSDLYPLVLIEHEDFDQVAEAAGVVMDLSSVPKDYHRMIRQIDSQGKVKPNPRALWEDLTPAATADDEATPVRPMRPVRGGKK